MTPSTGPLWTPLDGPQTQALESEADEVFYGGAAGSGKTDLLLGLALTRQWSSIIYRREYGQLRAIIERARAMIGSRGRFNETSGVWRLDNGRIIELGAVQHEHDKDKFQGRPHAAKLFDELPQFTESQYRFLIGWNRTTRRDERVRVVGAGNPPTTAEGEWVISRWAPWLDPQHPHPAEPGELRWYAVVGGEDVPCEDGAPFERNGETLYPRSRTFIPARVTDNPYLMATGYVATLQGMPEPLRSQMLYGDFTVGLTDHEWQVIPTAWVRQAQERWHPEGRGRRPLSSIGCDVAQGGSDNTLLQRRYGTWYAEPEVHPGATVPDANVNAGYVLRALAEGGVAHIDADGIGASTYFLVKAHVKDRAQSFLGSDQKIVHGETDSSGLLGFFNRRALAWWRFREKLDPAKNPEIALPPGRRVLSDLTAPHYEIVGGKIKLERKPDIIKRLGFSPDYGDAIVMADAEPTFGSALAQAFGQQWGAA